MPAGLFGATVGWAHVDYGAGTTIPVTRSKHDANGYKPRFRQASLGSRVLGRREQEGS
jgi:hypothetical protein